MQDKHQEITAYRQSITHPKRTIHRISACLNLASSKYFKKHNQALQFYTVQDEDKSDLLDPKLTRYNAHLILVIGNRKALIHQKKQMITRTKDQHH